MHNEKRDQKESIESQYRKVIVTDREPLLQTAGVGYGRWKVKFHNTIRLGEALFKAGCSTCAVHF